MDTFMSLIIVEMFITYQHIIPEKIVSKYNDHI